MQPKSTSGPGVKVAVIKHTQDRHEKKLNTIGGASHVHHCYLNRIIFSMSNGVLIAKKKGLLSIKKIGLVFGSLIKKN